MHTIMNSQKFFWVSLLWLISFNVYAQRTISGRITDADDGSSIPGAAVFIANTTVGTTTDAEGNYQLKIPGEGSYSLVISHVAYQPVFRDIEPGKTGGILHIAMRIRIQEIEEVEVTVKVQTRQWDKDLFWRTILGKKPSQKTIYAVNPEAVYFYYNAATQKLTVTCRVPLQIINYETGYQIQYVLDYFTHDYNTDHSSWRGQYMFTELESKNKKQKNAWKKNRENVYRISIVNFIKSLFQNTLFENGFLLTSRAKTHGSKFQLVDREDILQIDTVNNSKTLWIPPDSTTVLLFCFGRPITDKVMEDMNKKKLLAKIGLYRNALVTPGEPVHIFPDGTYRNPIWLSVRYLSNSLAGLNLILPTNYHPDGEPTQLATTTGYEQPVEASPANSLVDTLARVIERFEEQLVAFPQEKLHLHTDKPYYISGERIWFRAHVVNAASHIPSFSSNSVYVELFDARDSVISRVKTGLANDIFSGYISLPEDMPEGDYTIRAYTGGMRNLDEDYFFMKSIRVGTPMSRMIHALPEFKFLPDKKVGADIRFSRIRPLASITPESANISINGGKPMTLKFENGISGFSFDLLPNEKQRVMLLDAKYEKNPYRQYIKIPLPDDDFDVSFYPEGGSMLSGCTGRIAFKVMQRDGTEINISGVVYDQQGNEALQFKTDMRGVGVITMKPERGDRYYAVCTNDKGQSKRFDLPVAAEAGYSLSANWFKDRLIVQVRQPEHQTTADTLCLLVHIRGIVQDIRVLENLNELVVFRKETFSSGVSNLLLLDKNMVPISERLVFVYNDDQATVTCKSDRDAYPARSPVKYTVNIANESGGPLLGNFSVSVTDNHEVAADTTSSILTSLLLTSDIRGNIPDPGYYFRKKDQSSAYALDLLMLTQGWRRYDTERIIRNEFMYPDTLLGKDYEISGTVRTYLMRKPVENAGVSVLSFKGDFAQETFTDCDGRFHLQDGGAVDSTRLVVQTAPKLGNQKLELTLDKPSYPERKVPVVATGAPEREVFAKYADKAELQYVDEHGIRIIHLSEVAITAPKKKAINYSSYYRPEDARYSITEDDLKKFPAVNMGSLLMRLPGVIVSHSNKTISYGTKGTLLMVDDMKEDPADVLNTIDPSDIGQIDLLSGSVAAIFTGSIDSYVIALHTKRGQLNAPSKTPYIKSVMPLGFQKPVEFYAPKYDVPSQNAKPDLRMTIHWQPNITTDETGTASFNFYTADTPSTYTVLIEGVTADGKIVYQKDKIMIGTDNSLK